MLLSDHQTPDVLVGQLVINIVDDYIPGKCHQQSGCNGQY